MLNPVWDGILIDRSDPNESWIIDNSTARSIDPDQSNTLITNYTDFDNAWNDGLRRYMGKLRTAIGLNRLIYTNWGINNYSVLNGQQL